MILMEHVIIDGVYNIKQVLATRVKVQLWVMVDDTLYINGNGGVNTVIQANGTDTRVYSSTCRNRDYSWTATNHFNLTVRIHIKFFDALINNSMHLLV